ncbi:putative penicillin-binding protein PbpX [Oxobacter pfennigii]|uniref:Putative penicillin-binding protein PbpX n=1 Tax=Oxobacter pfennigii TaxID=36849 RepID=A0A0P8WDX6_9CLOT|nr:serine hydrolase domain-containing protein [Oxobacter pfennigii]KPU46284.1 putative penicillin-binding protein PbpX [Oxobacter pfennigii]
MCGKGMFWGIKKFLGLNKSRNISGQEPAKDIDYKRLEDRIKKISEKYKAAGISVAAVRNGVIDWTASLGYADKENKIAVTSATAFRVASISKVVTSMLVMSLWDKGIINLNEDISTYLGFKVKNPYYPDEPITLENIMTHTSSISDKGTYLAAVESGKGYPPLKEMLILEGAAYNMKNFYKYKPGSMNYNYSNFGYGIIAAIIESVTGKRFNDYAREAIFNPLNMNASYLPNYIEGAGNVANIYRDGALSFSKDIALKGEERVSKFLLGQLYLLAQGNLYISAPDMAKLMIVLMSDGGYEGARILSKEAVDVINKERTVALRGHNKMRGLGLHITHSLVKGRTLRGHQGRAYGATNEMFYDLEDKTGVVYLSNGSKYTKAFNGFAAIGSEIINAVYDEI